MPDRYKADNIFIVGKDTNPSHPSHVLFKFIADEKSVIGKVVEGEPVPRPVQYIHAFLKLVPLLTSSDGKDVRLEQLNHANPKSSPLVTVKLGKDVRP